MGRPPAPNASDPEGAGPGVGTCARPPVRLRAAACAVLVALACGMTVPAPTPALASSASAPAASSDNLLDILGDSGTRVLAWFGIGSREAVDAAADDGLTGILGDGFTRAKNLLLPSAADDGEAAGNGLSEAGDALAQATASTAGAGASADDVPADGTLREDKVQAVYDTLIAAARQGRTDTIDLSAIRPTGAEYDEAFDRLNLDPWWGHTAGTTRTNQGGVVAATRIRYRLDESMLPTYEADVSAALDALVAQVDPEASTYDKALYVYDWLQQNVTYDHETADNDVTNSVSRTALGALVYGSAVCSGYADAYCLALGRLGIPCELTDDYGTHVWNIVCLDGAWYYCDATWDDPDDESGPRHFYFMVSEATMARDHGAWPVVHDAPADLDRPDVIRYSPDECPVEDALTEVVYARYAGYVDLLDYGITGDDAMAITNGFNDSGTFYDVAFTWHWSCAEDGRLRCLWISW